MHRGGVGWRARGPFRSGRKKVTSSLTREGGKAQKKLEGSAESWWKLSPGIARKGGGLSGFGKEMKLANTVKMQRPNGGT